MKPLPLAALVIIVSAAGVGAQSSLAEQALDHLVEHSPTPQAPAAPAPPPNPRDDPAATFALTSLEETAAGQDMAESAPEIGARPWSPRGGVLALSILLVAVALVLVIGTAARMAWTIPQRVFGLEESSWIARSRPWLAAWRWPYAALVMPFRWWRRQVRRSTDADAGWETAAGVLAKYGRYRPGQGIPFGVFVFAGFMWFETLNYRGLLGMNLVGKPGSGKSSIFTYWLGSLAPDASAFFIDADGEIVRVIGDELVRQGHPLHVIDLLHGRSGRPAASYNVFAEYAAIEGEHGRAAVIPAMKMTGEALVVQENELQKTFDNGGRDFTVAVVGFVYQSEKIPAAKKTLTTVRELISSGLPTNPDKPKETPLDVLLFEMEDITRTDDRCDGMLNALIARGAAAIRSGNNRDGGNPFLGSAKRATGAWDLPAVVAATSRSDFLMSDLKRGSICVAVVCSVGDLRTTYQPLARLLVTMLEYRFTTMPPCRTTPAAVIIDEAQNLSQLSICLTGPYMRKYEMQLILGIQDLPGLEAVYGKRAESIISNAGMNCYLPTTDERTILSVSRQVGMCTVREKVEGTPWWLRLLLPRAQHVRNSYRNVERALKNFEQVRDTLTPGRSRMIVLGEGRCFIAGVIKYWKVLPVSRYARSIHPESRGRAFTRRRLRRGKP